MKILIEIEHDEKNKTKHAEIIARIKGLAIVADRCDALYRTNNNSYIRQTKGKELFNLKKCRSKWS